MIYCVSSVYVVLAKYLLCQLLHKSGTTEAVSDDVDQAYIIYIHTLTVNWASRKLGKSTANDERNDRFQH